MRLLLMGTQQGGPFEIFVWRHNSQIDPQNNNCSLVWSDVGVDSTQLNVPKNGQALL